MSAFSAVVWIRRNCRASGVCPAVADGLRKWFLCCTAAEGVYRGGCRSVLAARRQVLRPARTSVAMRAPLSQGAAGCGRRRREDARLTRAVMR